MGKLIGKLGRKTCGIPGTYGKYMEIWGRTPG
jgi:hypothetical protein